MPAGYVSRVQEAAACRHSEIYRMLKLTLPSLCRYEPVGDDGSPKAADASKGSKPQAPGIKPKAKSSRLQSAESGTEESTLHRSVRAPRCLKLPVAIASGSSQSKRGWRKRRCPALHEVSGIVAQRRPQGGS